MGNQEIIQKIRNFKEEFAMLFTPGLLLAAGATLIVAAAEKTMEEFGWHWLSTCLRIIVPLAGMAAGVYFLENNPIVWWLK